MWRFQHLEALRRGAGHSRSIRTKIVSIVDLPERQVSHNSEIEKRVMLCKEDLPHVTGFSQATFGPGQVAASHAHADMYEVFFVEAGAGVIRVDGDPTGWSRACASSWPPERSTRWPTTGPASWC